MRPGASRSPDTSTSVDDLDSSERGIGSSAVLQGEPHAAPQLKNGVVRGGRGRGGILLPVAPPPPRVRPAQPQSTQLLNWSRLAFDLPGAGPGTRRRGLLDPDPRIDGQRPSGPASTGLRSSSTISRWASTIAPTRASALQRPQVDGQAAPRKPSASGRSRASRPSPRLPRASAGRPGPRRPRAARPGSRPRRRRPPGRRPGR